MIKKCKNCKYFEENEETAPFCIACAYCRKRTHLLQCHLDGTLPVYCQVCNYPKWKEEFNQKTKIDYNMSKNNFTNR